MWLSRMASMATILVAPTVNVHATPWIIAADAFGDYQVIQDVTDNSAPRMGCQV